MSYIVQKIGMKGIFLILASLLSTGSLFMMKFSSNRPSFLYELSIYLFSLFFGIYVSCIWPSMTLTLPKTATNLGLGIASSAQNFGNIISPIILGILTESRDANGYGNGLTYLICFSVVCNVVTGILTFI